MIKIAEFSEFIVCSGAMKQCDVISISNSNFHPITGRKSEDRDTVT